MCADEANKQWPELSTPWGNAQWHKAATLFNTGEYWHCHEALEAVWLKATGDERLLLQGIIQTAAALIKYREGNLKGYQSLREQALIKLKMFNNFQPIQKILDFLDKTPNLSVNKSCISIPQIMPLK